MRAMTALLEAWETRHQRHIDFVLQVGDFEPHRHARDLQSASIPKRYRDLGDFPAFHHGSATFDWPVTFIGGNHEPFGFLEEMPRGGRAAPNCRYLGRVGRVELGGLVVVGLTGIYSERHHQTGRPRSRGFVYSEAKRYAYFSEEDVAAALAFGRADVLVLHEWPRGAITEDQYGSVMGLRKISDPRAVGNEPARLLVHRLRPKLVLAGHMHWRHRSRIGGAAFAALAHIDAGPEALGVFEERADGSIVELASLDDAPTAP
jgi:Icc-related predicted phosphoesterase